MTLQVGDLFCNFLFRGFYQGFPVGMVATVTAFMHRRFGQSYKYGQNLGAIGTVVVNCRHLTPDLFAGCRPCVPATSMFILSIFPHF